MHRSMLALAAHALAMAEGLDHKVRAATLWGFLPIGLLLSAADRLRRHRLRACVALLNALAALFAHGLPQPAEPGLSARQAPAPLAPTPTAPEWAAALGTVSLSRLLNDPAQSIPAVPVHHTRPPATRATNKRDPRQRPPAPRLLPPQRASPPPTASRQAA